MGILRSHLRTAWLPLAVCLAVLLAVPALAAATAPKCYEFALPTTSTDCSNVTASGDWVAWSESPATLKAMDLRTGSAFTVTTAGSPGGICAGVLAYVSRGADGLQPARIYLYDLATKTVYAQTVPVPDGLDASTATRDPKIGAGIVTFVCDVGGEDRVFAAPVDAAARTIGAPFAVSTSGMAEAGGGTDVSGTTAAWMQTNASPGIHAGMIDLTSTPAAVTDVFVAVATPVVDAVHPVISGDLVVWDTWETGPLPAIYGSRLDALTKTAGTPFLIVKSSNGGMKCQDPDLSGSLVVFRGQLNGTEGTSVYGVTLSSTSEPPTASGYFRIGGQSVMAGSCRVDAGLATWVEQTSTLGGTTKRPRAALVAPGKPVAKAPSAASVKSGGKAALKCRVDDRLWKAKVTITVKNASGHVVLTLKKGWLKANAVNTVKFTCKLRRGTYHFFVKGTSMAGLASKPASNKLTVR
jgi:hypothetical protein